MAKTTFANGTIVTPEFLNSIYEASGGHVHDGGSDDGSVKVIPVSLINNDSTVPGANAKLALETLNGVDSAQQSAINQIIGDNNVATVTGNMDVYGFEFPIQCNYLCIKRRYRGTGVNLVEAILFLPETYGTSTTVHLGFATATIPAGIRPQYVSHPTPMLVYVNNPVSEMGPVVMGAVEISSTGDWSIRNVDGGNFPDSGVKGFPAQIIRYVYGVE